MESSVIIVVIDGPIDRAGIPALCAGVLRLIDDSPATRVLVDVTALEAPDAATLDALARLRLAARRRGLDICLSRASPRLVELLALAGLQGILPLDDASGSEPDESGLEPGRQAEQRKEVGRVEEEGDPGDPVA
jgi:anti-anti-sigma factor